MSDRTRRELRLEHHYADVNGAVLHYVRGGSGPLMVFLHGFPQAWFIFRSQLQDFARDHTVVAVDLRGYNLSSKPRSPIDYGTWISAEDTRALVQQLGFERCILVGHDTGGAIAYSFALHHPQLLDRLVVLTTPHPALFDRELHENPDQAEASRYLLAVRQPSAPELVVRDDFAALRAIFEGHDFFSDRDVQLHLDAWRRPGAAGGMLGWYRHEGLGPREGGTPARGNTVPEVSPLTIGTPSMVVYAERDAYVLPACFEGLDEYMENLVLREVPGASHWLLNEHPELVSRYIREFLNGGASADRAPSMAPAGRHAR